MNAVTRILSLDREDMTDLERELFLKDFKRLADEYFEVEGGCELNITRGENGFFVCILFDARRIKNIRRVSPD